MACDSGFISIVDPFLNPDGTNWTGSITYTLLYATTVAGATIVNAEQQFNVSNGINICLAPGLYSVVLQQNGFAYRVTTAWGVPVSGGPYTVADIEGNITLQGSFGSVALSGTPSTGQVPTATGPTAARWQNPGGGGPLLSKTVTLQEADVLALGVTPFTILDAPGPTSVILPFNIVVQVNGTADYNADGLNINLGTNNIASLDPFGFGGFYTTYLVNDQISGAIFFGEGSSYANQPLTASATSGVTGSGGTMVITVFYALLTGVTA